MRSLIWAGLGLALSCLGAFCWAEEIQFRPPEQSTANTPPVTGSSGPAVAGDAVDPAIQRISFTQGGSTPVQFRAKGQESGPPPLPSEPAAVPLPAEPVNLPTTGEPKKNPPAAETPKSTPKKNGPAGDATKGDAKKAVTTDEPPKAEPNKSFLIEEGQKGGPQKPELMPLPMPKDNSSKQLDKSTIIVAGPDQASVTGTLIPDGCCGGSVIGGACCGDSWCGESCCPEWLTWCRNKLSCRSCCCDTCTLPLFYASGEFLFWRVSRDHAPTLVTTTTLTPTDIFNLSQSRPVRPGALGELGTVPLFGGAVENPDFFGGRFTVGFGNLLSCGLGFEATFFFLGDSAKRFNFSSDDTGRPALFSPFIDGNGTGQSLFVAFPDQLKGAVVVEHSTRIWGIEANLRKALICDCEHKLDFLAGFRFIQLTENLSITRANQCIVPGCGDEVSLINDTFATRNRFYGGQVGFDYQYHMHRWIFGVTGKLAIGEMLQTVQINGTTVMGMGGNFSVTNVGLLAQDTNIGQHSRDRFAIVPEVGLKVGYQITDNLTAFVGYSALYMSDVLRPGQQVDLVVDKTGTLQRPRVPFNGSGFWAQGFNAGIEWKY